MALGFQQFPPRQLRLLAGNQNANGGGERQSWLVQESKPGPSPRITDAALESQVTRGPPPQALSGFGCWKGMRSVVAAIPIPVKYWASAVWTRTLCNPGPRWEWGDGPPHRQACSRVPAEPRRPRGRNGGRPAPCRAPPRGMAPYKEELAGTPVLDCFGDPGQLPAPAPAHS